MDAKFESSEAAILARLFRPDVGGWPRAAAEAILSAGFNDIDRERMVGLLEKAKTEELLSDEAKTLESCRHIGRLLEVMKSKARQSLRTAPKA